MNEGWIGLGNVYLIAMLVPIAFSFHRLKDKTTGQKRWRFLPGLFFSGFVALMPLPILMTIEVLTHLDIMDHIIPWYIVCATILFFPIFILVKRKKQTAEPAA